MERLTKRDLFDGAIELTKENWEPIAPYNEVMEALEKLAAYEDTGLELEAIRTLAADFSMCAAALASHQKNEKGKTNADRLRQMTDDELADFIAMQRFSVVNPIADTLGIDVTTAFIAGRKNALNWLKHEVKKDG